MPPEETSRGLEYLQNIVESGRILKVNARAINQGWSYLLHFTGLTKEWYFALSRNQIDDLPGTKDHHATANAPRPLTGQ